MRVASHSLLVASHPVREPCDAHDRSKYLFLHNDHIFRDIRKDRWGVELTSRQRVTYCWRFATIEKLGTFGNCVVNQALQVLGMLRHAKGTAVYLHPQNRIRSDPSNSTIHFSVFECDADRHQ